MIGYAETISWDRFDLVRGTDVEDATVYSASHELHNTVDIHFPPYYWTNQPGGPPAHIDFKPTFQFTIPEDA